MLNRMWYPGIVLLLSLSIACGDAVVYMAFEMHPRIVLGHFLVTLGIALFGVPLLLRRRPWLFVVLLLGTILYLNVNEYFFYYFLSFIHVRSAPTYLRDFLGLIRGWSLPGMTTNLIFFPEVLLVVYVACRWTGVREGVFAAPARLGRGAALAALAAGIAACWTAPRPGFPSGNYSGIDHYAIVARYGLIGHTVSDILSPGRERGAVSSISYGPLVSGSGRLGRHANILLLQVESMDAFAVSATYRGRYVMPYLHDLSERCVYYPYALCYRRCGGTSDCEVAVMNGMEPLADVPTIHSAYRYPNSFAGLLGREGYATAAFHGNVGTFYNRRQAYSKMGYREFFDIDRMGLKEKGWGACDGDVFDFVLRRMRSEKNPFCYYVVTMSSHEPFHNVLHYSDPSPYRGIRTDLDRNYLVSMDYVDRMLQRFVEEVRRLKPDTYIFIYGDHTPYVLNGGPYRRAVVKTPRGEQEFVPLLIVTPDSRTYRETERVASYLDVARTVLAAAGAPFGVNSFGDDLLRLPFRGGKVVYRNVMRDRRDLFSAIAIEAPGGDIPDRPKETEN